MLVSEGSRVTALKVSKPCIPAATQSVPSLEKALSILEMIASSHSGLSLPDLVKKSGLPKSSVHCILVTMQRREYLQRNENTGRYVFALKLFSLGNMALSGLQLREQAEPCLFALMQQTRLTTHMAILEQDEAVLIAKVSGPSIFSLATWIGKRMDVHCTALGKALIAHLPGSKLDRLLRKRSLPRHNENTIASSKCLKEHLANIVRLGYAVDDEEDEIGLRCIGAPVFNHAGGVIAAISVSGTTAQITEDNASRFAQRVKDTAAAISHVVGHSPQLTSEARSV